MSKSNFSILNMLVEQPFDSTQGRKLRKYNQKYFKLLGWIQKALDPFGYAQGQY